MAAIATRHMRIGARWKRAAMLLLVSSLAALAGCSGGGGGGGGGTSRTPGFFETQEYGANPGLGQIRASSAYAEGATGDGVRIGVVDTGIDVDHPEFADKIAAASTDVVTGDPAMVDDADGHGTAVAGLIAARRNGEASHGVAFDAELLAVRAERRGSCSPGCVFDEEDVAAATDHAVANGARVINYSLGGSASISGTLEAALERAVDAGVVVVFAAGNSGDADPTFPGRFAADAGADGRAVVVGAVDGDDDIAAFSNRAGVARQMYLVAPGVGVVTTARGGGAIAVAGTSFSTPHVAGALALLLDAFPSLDADEAVDLLLSTSRDLGEGGTDAIYGRGRLDLAEALRPQGTLSVPTGSSSSGALVPLDGSELSLGPAFGAGPRLGRAMFLDGWGRPYALDLDRRIETSGHGVDLRRWLEPRAGARSVSAPLGRRAGMTLSLDVSDDEPPLSPLREQGREVDGFTLTASSGEGTRIAAARGWGIGGEFGLAAARPSTVASLIGGVAARSPYLAFADGGDGVVVAHAIDDGMELRVGFAEEHPAAGPVLDPGRRSVAVAELVGHLPRGGTLGVEVGHLAESESVLATTGGGAFALGGGETAFVGINAALPLADQLTAFGHAALGTTRADDAAASLITDVSAVRSSAFALGLARSSLWRPDDRLTLLVAQPLRIETGTATLERPVAMTADGDILRVSDEVGLAPQGRELDLELAYTVRLAAGGVLGINWVTQLQPGHDAAASTAHAVAVRWQRRF